MKLIHLTGAAAVFTVFALTAPSLFFFSSRRRHTISLCDWSSDVCSSDLLVGPRHKLDRPHDGDLDPQARELVGVHRNEAGVAEGRRDRARRHGMVERMDGMDRADAARSEERRVGKEWRGRWAAYVDKRGT